MIAVCATDRNPARALPAMRRPGSLFSGAGRVPGDHLPGLPPREPHQVRFLPTGVQPRMSERVPELVRMNVTDPGLPAAPVEQHFERLKLRTAHFRQATAQAAPRTGAGDGHAGRCAAPSPNRTAPRGRGGPCPSRASEWVISYATPRGSRMEAVAGPSSSTITKCPSSASGSRSEIHGPRDESCSRFAWAASTNPPVQPSGHGIHSPHVAVRWLVENGYGPAERYPEVAVLRSHR